MRFVFVLSLKEKPHNRYAVVPIIYIMLVLNVTYDMDIRM